MRFRRAGWMMLLLVPVMVQAEPTTRPASPSKMRPPSNRSDRMSFRERFEADWEEAFAFFQKYSPHRAAAFSSMSDSHKARYKPLIVARYRSVRWLTRDDEQLRKVKIRQIETEDRIFAIKSRLMEEDLAPDDVEQLRKELRQKVGELVEAQMDERKERIARLELLLTAEKQRLEKDLARQDQLIDSRYRDVLDARRPDIAGESPRRYGGGERGGERGERGGERGGHKGR